MSDPTDEPKFCDRCGQEIDPFQLGEYCDICQDEVDCEEAEAEDELNTAILENFLGC
jgi:hypothetical protein